MMIRTGVVQRGHKPQAGAPAKRAVHRIGAALNTPSQLIVVSLRLPILAGALSSIPQVASLPTDQRQTP
jgi:hypothetical protein